MNVRLAKNSGFCFGVKRAINIALEAAEKYDDIVTLGPIIHNPQMVKNLKEQGIRNVMKISEINKRPTIIRSHGIKKDVFEKLKTEHIEIINATCPYVSKTQQYAEQLCNEGYQLVILGDKDHPEVNALQSYSNKKVIIVSDPKELPGNHFNKIGVISQTTRTIEDLKDLVSSLIPKCRELKVMNTICNATSVRQSATIKLAKESDLMIVIGGKNSSNTKMLARICSKIIETHHIEVAEEIGKEWFNNKCDIGLTAGASTPDWIIVEVYNKISECLGDIIMKASSIADIPGFKEKK
ncbi:MAG: 4-hydroxy-3-methylbut-2-enyl diphosphate reductase [Candidatus Cloacimonetes bacterium]|nr:4-hydroxy-3-methylbut-2-enyl diphosphate reductase [Candidatus Cloacimonadota bacterium]